MPPLPTSSFQPVVTLSHPLLSSNASYNKCKEVKDYRERTRIEFPGGWNDTDDEIFQWYRSQPFRRFQTIEYCKERNGVQHEFIRILLQNDQGDPVSSFCRIERVADLEHRIEAVTSRGTTAFDFIQTIDPKNPLDSKAPSELLVENDENPEVLAQIAFPRPLDLRDLIAACYGIHKHPLARFYTLQQYNCYFFSWAIILCLARHTVNWDDILRGHLEVLRGSVLNHISDLGTSGKLTIWSVVLKAGEVQTMSTCQDQPQLIQRLLSEINGQVFLSLVSKILLPLLWHNGYAFNLRTGLGDWLDDVVHKSTDPSLERLLVGSKKDLDSFFHTMTCEAFKSEFIRICKATWMEVDDEGRHKRCQQETKMIKRYYAPHSIRLHLRALGRICLWAPLIVLCLPILLAMIFSVFILNWRHLYDHEVSLWCCNENQKGLRQGAIIALAKSVLHIPRCLYRTVQLTSDGYGRQYHASLARHARKAGLCSEEDFPKNITMDDRIDLAVAVNDLSRSLNIYHSRHRGGNIEDLRDLAIEAVDYFCANYPDRLTDQYNMERLWKLSFRYDLGLVIARSVRDIIKQFTNELSTFQWIPGSAAEGSQHPSETIPLQLSHAELQDRIRKRIAQLSKWEVEGAPIKPYMRHVTFTMSPEESQAQMEQTIERIWGLCGPLMTPAGRNGPVVVVKERDSWVGEL